MARQLYSALILLLAIAFPCYAADKPPESKTAQVQPAVAKPEPKAPAWAQLSPTQKKLLAELEPQWPQLTDRLRNNLVKVADKYPTMKPDEQERVRRRITRWASLTPEQRDAARERYKQIKKQPPEKQKEVQKKWERYETQKAPAVTSSPVQPFTAVPLPAPVKDAPPSTLSPTKK